MKKNKEAGCLSSLGEFVFKPRYPIKEGCFLIWITETRVNTVMRFKLPNQLTIKNIQERKLRTSKFGETNPRFSCTKEKDKEKTL